jgi:hypothetical protein
MKTSLKFPMIKLNSLFVFPFIYVLFCLGVGELLSLLGVDKPTSTLEMLLAWPLLLAYYFLPTLGAFILPVLTIFNIVCFFKSKTIKEKIILGIYFLIYAVFDAHVIGWYWTGQKFDYI